MMQDVVAKFDEPVADAVGHRRRDRILYGIAVGGLIGSLWFCTDALAVAYLGRRISWMVLAILATTYLVCGCLGGGCAAIVHRILSRRRAASHSAGDSIRHVCVVGCAAVVAIIFVERCTRGDYDDRLGQSVGYPSLLAGLAVGAGLLLATTRFDIQFGSPRFFAWNVVSLLLFCIFWKSFNELYHAPGLDVKSLAANAVYGAAAICVYLAGRRVVGLVPVIIRFGTTRSCAWSAMSVFAGALVVSNAVVWWRTPVPYVTADGTIDGADRVKVTDRPNVILIVIDTVRADHLSLYGYNRNTTPNLTRFAKNAKVFRNAIATSSWTIPSHASMFTGLMPSEHGARISKVQTASKERVFPRLASKYETLAEVLSASGYETAAIVANLTLSRAAGMAQGFRYYDNRERIALDTAMCRTLSPAQWIVGACRRYTPNDVRPDKVFDASRDASEITLLVSDWIDQSSESPFFLYVNYMDAHNPFHAHPEFAEQLVRTDRLGGAASGEPPPLPIPVDLIDDVEKYDAEIAYLDAHLGALFGYLEGKGLFEETLVIVVGDHGESFGEHGVVGHCESLFGEEIHVPLVVRFPRGERGADDASFTSLASLHSLILSHVGLVSSSDDHPSRHDDESFVLAELHTTHGTVIRSLHTPDGMKYITGIRGHPDRLYDLRRDPFETIDLASKRPEFTKWASTWLDDWRSRAALHTETEDSSFVVDDAMLEKLRTLGYIE